ncbi:MAG: SDR family oxidoreductase [Chloroflexota bacterium]|nr:SDR family oxidoreductase [Chloroflexota bacterium]
MGRLSGNVALVTGAARGIGKGIATELAREGADVVICDLLIDEAVRTAGELRDDHEVRAVALEMDVTSEDSIESQVAEAISQMGQIDILVNNAGVPPDNFGIDETEEDWDRCYEVNLKGIWKVTSAVAPHFKERGGGKIVNIASIAGRIGGGMASYSASKAGAISITQSQAAELGRFNINVNAICPGLLWTDLWRQIEGMFAGDHTEEVVDRRERFEAVIAANMPLAREQTPSDIGKAAVFFASDDAKNITGQSLNVDGGMRMN